MHWVLDVAFNEDLSRKRKGNAAENYSSINRFVLNLLRKEDTKIGIKAKRKMAGSDNDFLAKGMVINLDAFALDNSSEMLKSNEIMHIFAATVAELHTIRTALGSFFYIPMPSKPARTVSELNCFTQKQKYAVQRSAGSGTFS